MIAVVRVRGSVGVRTDIEDTLEMLGLNTINSCVLVPEGDTHKGMIEKVKDFVTYGKIKSETLLMLIKKRGRLIGDKKLVEENVKETGFDSIEKMAKSIFEEKVKIKGIPKFKRVFRLTPPSKGFKSIKEHYPKGDLGNRGEKINELLERMV